MNLDDYISFKQIDPQDIITLIDHLPDQLETAWQLGQVLDLPAWEGLSQIVVTGLGGSAIGADLLAAYIAPRSRLPLVLLRDYELPAWASGPHTLVIASSFSGNTEETLAAFQQATMNRCRRIAITSGGALAQAARDTEAALWSFDHNGPPRTAVAFSFGLLLAALARLGLLEEQASIENDVCEAVEVMRQQGQLLSIEVPTSRNPAKRLAGQMIDRLVIVFASGPQVPVARRWKGQINELAKAWAEFDTLPEANHNTLEGMLNSEKLLSQALVIFLKSPSDHPRNRLRADLMQKMMMVEGINTDSVEGQGHASLAHVWSNLQFGDYTAFYLAMAYGVDPTPVMGIEEFKKAMKAASSQ